MKYLIAVLCIACEQKDKVTVSLITGGRVTWYVHKVRQLKKTCTIGTATIDFENISSITVHAKTTVHVARKTK